MKKKMKRFGADGGRNRSTWIMNQEQKGSLFVYHEGEKVSEWDGNNFNYTYENIGGTAIKLTAGADIYRADGTQVYSEGDVIKERVEPDRFGTIVISGLTLGTYEVTELDSITGYLKSEIPHSVTIEYVTLRGYLDMISIYGFDANQVELLETLMSPECLAMLGYSGGSELGQSSISMLEKEKILSGITDERQQKVCSFALSKVGYPYSQAYRDSGDYYDCSSLAFYAWKYADVNISYEGATTAAAEAQGLEEAGKTVAYEELQPGDLIFFSYCHNGRYRNISHVAIYVGDGKVVEAKNESAGVVYGDIPNPECIVMIGRP